MNYDPLIQALQNKDLYDHPVSEFKVIETHISWIILTGKYAYKIKKSLNLVFLDFSTLEKRKHFCQEELRLNRPMAPMIYLEVLAIKGHKEQPTFKGDGPVFEYALKMLEFPQTALFDHLLAEEKLTPSLIDSTAEQMVLLHQQTAVDIDKTTLGTATQVHEPVVQNFTQVEPMLSEANDIVRLKKIAQWAFDEHRKISDDLTLRKQQGFIRECHGDIHLGNIALFDNKPILFDCIEFNEPFRWTDTMADLGFLAMDLEDHGRFDYSHRLVNATLKLSGDYHGLTVLKYYKSYRAMVRAKVALFQRMQCNNPAEQESLYLRYQRCITLAEHYMMPSQPTLILMHGHSASGKSLVCNQLVDSLGVIQLSSDIERKRVAQQNLTTIKHNPVLGGIYSKEHTEQTYQRLLSLAKLILATQHSVIVDARFAEQAHRAQFKQLAAQLNIPFLIIHTHAKEQTLRQRIHQRYQKAQGISEAYDDVLTMQLQNTEALTAEELAHTISVDMDHFTTIDSVLAQYHQRLE